LFRIARVTGSNSGLAGRRLPPLFLADAVMLS